MKLVVAGYYGCGNLGDDALLCSLVHHLGGDHQIIATSGHPDKTATMFGINAIPRKNISELASAIKNADALVFGGGGLLQDTTSLLSLKYYTHLISVAAKAGKLIALLGQGIGPISSFLGRRAATTAFKACDLICVRDEGSMALVRDLVPNSQATQAITDDLAWLLPTPPKVERSRSIAISARPWKGQTEKIRAAFVEFCRRAEQAGWSIVPASFDRGMDDGLLSQIAPSAERSLFTDDPRILLEGLSEVGGTVALRLHAGILSVITGMCPTMISYDQKVTAFSRSIEQEALSLDNLTGERLWLAFTERQAGRERWDEIARNRRDAGAARSIENIQMLEDLLQHGRVPRRV